MGIDIVADDAVRPPPLDDTVSREARALFRPLLRMIRERQMRKNLL